MNEISATDIALIGNLFFSQILIDIPVLLPM